MTITHLIAIITELLGIIGITMGIIIEIKHKAHYGLIIITVSALLVSIGGIIWAKIAPLMLM